VSKPDKVRVVAWALLHPPLVFAFQSTEILREMQIPDAFHSDGVPRAEILGDGQKSGESSSALLPNLHASDIKGEVNVIVDSMPTTTQVHADAPIPEAPVDVQPWVVCAGLDEIVQVGFVKAQHFYCCHHVLPSSLAV
jgi:hypothetical protein